MLIYITKDSRIKTVSEKVFLGILWVLTRKNTQEGFFQKEHIELLGSVATYNRITKQLTDLNIVSFEVRGCSFLKHRFFKITDQKIIEEFTEATKTSKERKNLKSGTQTPLSDQNSILCNFGSDLSNLFARVADDLIKARKISPMINLNYEMTVFIDYYRNKQINYDTVEHWLINAK